ncbi:hypothetical protein GCM10017687_88040 [Streptomyces echinatus]
MVDARTGAVDASEGELGGPCWTRIEDVDGWLTPRATAPLDSVRIQTFNVLRVTRDHDAFIVHHADASWVRM